MHILCYLLLKLVVFCYIQTLPQKWISFSHIAVYSHSSVFLWTLLHICFYLMHFYAIFCFHCLLLNPELTAKIYFLLAPCWLFTYFCIPAYNCQKKESREKHLLCYLLASTWALLLELDVLDFFFQGCMLFS